MMPTIPHILSCLDGTAAQAKTFHDTRFDPTRNNPSPIDRPEKRSARVDENGDGAVDKAEFSVMAERMQERKGVSIDVDTAMAEMDTDGDGSLSQEELGTGFRTHFDP